MGVLGELLVSGRVKLTPCLAWPLAPHEAQHTMIRLSKLIMSLLVDTWQVFRLLHPEVWGSTDGFLICETMVSLQYMVSLAAINGIYSSNLYLYNFTYSGCWWFQVSTRLKNMRTVKMAWNLPQIIGVTIKQYLSCRHPVYVPLLILGE